MPCQFSGEVVDNMVFFRIHTLCQAVLAAYTYILLIELIIGNGSELLAFVKWFNDSPPILKPQPHLW